LLSTSTICGSELAKQKIAIASYPPGHFRQFVDNLLDGVEHYRGLAGRLVGASQNRFLEQLEVLNREVRGLLRPKRASARCRRPLPPPTGGVAGGQSAAESLPANRQLHDLFLQSDCGSSTT